MTEYTDAMVAELKALSPVDNDKAVAFAEKHGISVHSVRAKCVRDDEITYQAKPKVRKDGSPVERKSAIVADIAELCGSDEETFESLGNATRNVLVALRGALEG